MPKRVVPGGRLGGVGEVSGGVRLAVCVGAAAGAGEDAGADVCVASVSGAFGAVSVLASRGALSGKGGEASSVSAPLTAGLDVGDTAAVCIGAGAGEGAPAGFPVAGADADALSADDAAFSDDDVEGVADASDDPGEGDGAEAAASVSLLPDPAVCGAGGAAATG